MDDFSVCVRFYFDRIKANDETLRIINFKNSGMRDADIDGFCKVLSENTRVESILLTDNYLTDAGLEPLCKTLESNQSVTTLDLTGNSGITMTKPLKELLAKNYQIKIVMVDATFDDELRELLDLNYRPKLLKTTIQSMRSGNRDCERVDFSASPGLCLSDQCLALLVRGVLEYPRCIRMLDLSGVNVGDERQKTIAAILTISTTLVEIRLRGNEITHIGATYLATALTTNESVTELDLSNNCIGDRGASAFVAALKQNRSALSFVHVSYNNISPGIQDSLVTTLMQSAQPKSFKAIYEDLITNNRRTQRCVLSQYEEEDPLRLSDASMCLLVQALVGNTFLIYLDLANNKIGDDGAAKLGFLLQNNNKLRTLLLDGNMITTEGAAHLVTGVRHNSSLDELSLDRQVPLPLPRTLLEDISLLVQMNKHPIVMKKQGGLLMDSDPSLTTFDLSFYDGVRHCTDKTLKILGEALKKNTKLRELHLGNNGGHTTLASFATLVNGLAAGPAPALVELHLNNNHLNDTMTPCLIQLLQSSRTLKTLNLSQNDFQETQPFVEALSKNNNTLTKLDITKNPKVTEQQCARLSLLCSYNTQRSTLKQLLLLVEKNSPTTTELNLVEYVCGAGTSSYSFGHSYNDESVRLLCIALANNTFVKLLDLNGNAVSDVGIGYLADMLKVNRALEELRIDDNQVTDVGVEILSNAVLQNHSLRRLSYERNPFHLPVNHPARKKINVGLTSNQSRKTSVFSVLDGAGALTLDQMKLIDDELLHDALNYMKSPIRR